MATKKRYIDFLQQDGGFDEIQKNSGSYAQNRNTYESRMQRADIPYHNQILDSHTLIHSRLSVSRRTPIKIYSCDIESPPFYTTVETVSYSPVLMRALSDDWRPDIENCANNGAEYITITTTGVGYTSLGFILSFLETHTLRMNGAMPTLSELPTLFTAAEYLIIPNLTKSLASLWLEEYPG